MLIPEVALIKLNAVFPEQEPEVVRERFFAMVLVRVLVWIISRGLRRAPLALVSGSKA